MSFDPGYAGAPKIEDIDLIYDSPYGTLPAPARDGYTFDGWYDENTNKVESNTTVGIAKDHTLTAHWTANKATITLNYNDGTDNPTTSTQQTTYDQGYDFSGIQPTREGYTFKGWFTEAEEGTEVEAKGTSAFEVDQTLYAHWEANKYDLTLDLNDGTSLTTTQVIYGDAYGNALNVPTRTGYDFDGWFDKDGNEFKSDDVVNITGPQKLTAHWTAKQPTITLDYNDGTSTTSEQHPTYGQSYDFSSVQPSRQGYTFNGWFTEAEGGTPVAASGTSVFETDQTLYAQWTAKTATITLNYNDGTASPATSTQQTTYDQDYDFSDIQPTRQGYVFKGWFTQATGGTQVNEKGTSAFEVDQTLYAQWDLEEEPEKTYKVTLDMGGAGDNREIEIKAGKTYTYQDILPTSPTRTGYTFMGWLSSDGKTPLNLSDTVSLADHTIYASWEANTYQVSFDFGYSGAPEIPEESRTYDSPYETLPNAPERDGYTFVGWYNEKGEKVGSSTTVGLAKDHTLTARWTQDQPDPGPVDPPDPPDPPGPSTGTSTGTSGLGQVSDTSSSGNGRPLILQIGNTADSFNQLEISIRDMHVAALGIAGLGIATQAEAAQAIAGVRNSINYVSSVRGDLGAYQNRLEHTEKNLSITRENLQVAESVIRDADIANEMMKIVKYNILTQSAQVMLAQANQVPQSVLQLIR